MAKVAFVQDYDLKVGSGSSYSVYHFKVGDKGTPVRYNENDENGVWVLFPNLGEFRIPYHVLGLRSAPKPAPRAKTRFEIIGED